MRPRRAHVLAALLAGAASGCFSTFPAPDEGNCGDDICRDGERCGEPGECEFDCGSCSICGDLVCEWDEGCDWCSVDCGECCGFGACCGDGFCDPSTETCGTCPKDCGTCGTCGNLVCDSADGEECGNCPADCGTCGVFCGNDLCEDGEACADCARECLCLAPGLHEEFAGNFDLANAVVTFDPDLGLGYFQTWGCALGLLDTPGTGAVSYSVALAGGDAAAEIVLPFGFEFFGVVRATAWVSANGHLTFAAPDTGIPAGVPAFYAADRVAPLYADLTLGQVLVDEFADRVAVTWTGAAEIGTMLPAPSFQAVLRADGSVSFAYGDEGAPAVAVVGLAVAGGVPGTPLDFAPGSCGDTYGPPGLYEQFTNGTDVDATSITYLWDGVGYSFFATTGTVVLPEGIGAGTVSTVYPDLIDDSAELVSLSVPVPWWGTFVDAVWVTSNGRIDFSGDDPNTYSESPASHFSSSRLSLLFDDLNPAVAGLVAVDEYADHVTFTYANVTEFGALNSNTFQAQIYVDGTIVTTYLEVDAADGLVGLSNGNPTGLPLPEPVDLVP